MKLFLLCVVWCAGALALGHFISFSVNNRRTIKKGLLLILLSFIIGVGIMSYAIASL